jgi:deoxyribonuclease-4
VRIGFHVSVGKGLLQTARHARAIGCECLQIFARNARGWRGRAYPEREVEGFKRLLSEYQIGPLIVHSCYLVNLASPAAELRERSRWAVADDMRRGAMLGSRVVNVHTGYQVGEEVGRAIAILAGSIRTVLADAPPEVDLLLENAAGRHRLGTDWRHFARLLEELAGEPRVGICFDTCHAHAAGHRLDSPRWIRRSLQEFDAVLGLERLRLIHLNDSRGLPGSHLDRHQHIGKGTIGDRGFRAFLRRRVLQDRCAILETPLEHPDDDARNLRRARQLAGRPQFRRSSAGMGPP